MNWRHYLLIAGNLAALPWTWAWSIKGATLGFPLFLAQWHLIVSLLLYFFIWGALSKIFPKASKLSPNVHSNAGGSGAAPK